MRYLMMALLAGLLTLPCLADHGPNLDVRKILVTGKPTPGEEVQVTVVIINRGDATSYGISCALSCEGTEWGVLSTGQELPAGKETTLEGRLTVPQGKPVNLGSDGQPKLQARMGQFFLPDLTVENIQLPESISRGEPAEVKVRIRNRGKGPAGGPVLELRVDGKPVEAKRTLERLNEGQSEEVVLNWIPEKDGKVQLTAVIDPGHKIEEQDEGNNSLTVAAQVSAERSTQLRLMELVAETRDPRVGSPVRLRVGLLNTGDLEVYRIPLVLKVDGKEVLAKTIYAVVQPKVQAEIYLQYNPTRPGRQTLTVLLGPSGVKAEPALRNVVTANLEVAARAGYKLKVVSVEAPTRMTLGKEYVLTAVVANSGDMPADACHVALLQNGVKVATGRSKLGLVLAPGQEARITLRFSPDKPGLVRLGATASGAGVEGNAEGEKQYEMEVKVEQPEPR